MTHNQMDRMTHVAPLAEQNLELGVGTLNGMMRTVHRAADALGRQASSIRERSLRLLERSMANAAELGDTLARSKDPLQWAEAHSQFLRKQAQAVARSAQSFGETFTNNSPELASAGPQPVQTAPPTREPRPQPVQKASRKRTPARQPVQKASRKRAAGRHQVQKASRKRAKVA
jgi:phasin protein